MIALLLLAACADGRDPLEFTVVHAPAPDCTGVDSLELPLEQVWLQQPAGVAWHVPSLVSPAWAHPGHDPAGDVNGEAYGPWTLRPCGDAEPLGDGLGYEGSVASAQLTLFGRARLLADLDGQPVDITLDLDHPVVGIPLDADLVDGAQVSMVFDPSLTLSVLPVNDTDGDGFLTALDPGVAESFLYGLANPNSWTLTLETPR